MPLKKAVLTIGTGSVTAGIILCLIVKPIRQTVKKNTDSARRILAFFKNRPRRTLRTSEKSAIIGRITERAEKSVFGGDKSGKNDK